jgi:hypothetical protein
MYSVSRSVMTSDIGCTEKSRDFSHCFLLLLTAQVTTFVNVTFKTGECVSNSRSASFTILLFHRSTAWAILRRLNWVANEWKSQCPGRRISRRG